MLSPGESTKSYLVSAMRSRSQQRKKRTICYIDGFNLYYGLKESGWRNLYWLNVREMAARLVRSPFVLAQTKYYTARIRGAHDKDSPEKALDREASRRRQQTFIEAIETLDAVEIHEGHFLWKRDYCRSCGNDFYLAEEKMTDVQIATHLVADAFLDRFDSALIVSGDSDLVPPVNIVRQNFPQKSIVAVFPPKRHSAELANAANHSMHLWETTLENSQFPDVVRKKDGTELRRPAEWN